MPRHKTPDTPPGVKDAVIREAAAMPVKAHGKIQTLARRFAMSEMAVESLLRRDKPKVQEMREAISNFGFTVAGHLATRIQEDLCDDGKMKETELRDKAKAFEQITSASIDLSDGHAPTIQVNIGQLKNYQKSIAAFDEMKRARGKTA